VFIPWRFFGGMVDLGGAAVVACLAVLLRMRWLGLSILE
jgi:hypothetical protein